MARNAIEPWISGCRNDSGVPARTRLIDFAAERSRAMELGIGREIRDARLDRNLSLRDVSAAVGISIAQASRIERGLVIGVSLSILTAMAAAVGLDLSTKVYPSGPPLRDAGHVALLGRLRKGLHRSLDLRTEIPLPILGDKRAWDASIDGPGWWIPVEAETRPRDFQALDRRIALKQRDSGAERVLLLLLASRHNTDFVRLNESALLARYPLPGRRALQLLGAGAALPQSAVILL